MYLYFICFLIATTMIWYDNQTPKLSSIMHCRRVRPFHSQATLMRNENWRWTARGHKIYWDDEWCYTVCEQGFGWASAEGKQGEARWSGLALSRCFVQCYFYPRSWITIIYFTLHIQGSSHIIHMSKEYGKTLLTAWLSKKNSIYKTLYINKFTESTEDRIKRSKSNLKYVKKQLLSRI